MAGLLRWRPEQPLRLFAKTMGVAKLLLLFVSFAISIVMAQQQLDASVVACAACAASAASCAACAADERIVCTLYGMLILTTAFFLMLTLHNSQEHAREADSSANATPKRNNNNHNVSVNIAQLYDFFANDHCARWSYCAGQLSCSDDSRSVRASSGAVGQVLL